MDQHKVFYQYTQDSWLVIPKPKSMGCHKNEESMLYASVVYPYDIQKAYFLTNLSKCDVPRS